LRRKRTAPESLQEFAVKALASITCSKKLKTFAGKHHGGMSPSSQFAMALQMRTEDLHHFLTEMVAPMSPKSRLKFLLEHLELEEKQTLIAHIYYEAHRADRKDEFNMAFKLNDLLFQTLDKWPKTEDLEEVKRIEPFCRQGLYYVCSVDHTEPRRRLANLFFDYFESRWMPVVGLYRDIFAPDHRVTLWTDEFNYVDLHKRQEQFVEPDFIGFRQIEPAEDKDFVLEEWVFAGLRGLSDACNEKRYPLALALGFRILEKCATCPLLAGSYRCDIWAYLAEACAAINPSEPDEALLCLLRMKESAKIPSDFHSIQLAEAKVMILLERDISGLFYKAKNDPTLVRQSEFFFKILISHLQGLFLQCEDHLLSYVRELLRHSICRNGLTHCQTERARIKHSLRLLVTEMMTLAENKGMFMSSDRWIPIQVYFLLAKIMKFFLRHIEEHENGREYNSTKLMRLVCKLNDLKQKHDFDWHITYVYYALAPTWILNQDTVEYHQELNVLIEGMSEHIGQTRSIIQCQMAYSALVFMLLSQPLRTSALQVDEILIHDVHFHYFSTPGLEPMNTNFRSQLTLDLYYQIILVPDSKHSAFDETGGITDNFWSVNPHPWSDVRSLSQRTQDDFLKSYLSGSDCKDICLVQFLRNHDKTHQTLSNAERFGLETLGKQRFF
jgi:hypothetical protein